MAESHLNFEGEGVSRAVERGHGVELPAPRAVTRIELKPHRYPEDERQKVFQRLPLTCAMQPPVEGLPDVGALS